MNTTADRQREALEDLTELVGVFQERARLGERTPFVEPIGYTELLRRTFSRLRERFSDGTRKVVDESELERILDSRTYGQLGSITAFNEKVSAVRQAARAEVGTMEEQDDLLEDIAGVASRIRGPFPLAALIVLSIVGIAGYGFETPAGVFITSLAAPLLVFALLPWPLLIAELRWVAGVVLVLLALLPFAGIGSAVYLATERSRSAGDSELSPTSSGTAESVKTGGTVPVGSPATPSGCVDWEAPFCRRYEVDVGSGGRVLRAPGDGKNLWELSFGDQEPEQRFRVEASGVITCLTAFGPFCHHVDGDPGKASHRNQWYSFFELEAGRQEVKKVRETIRSAGRSSSDPVNLAVAVVSEDGNMRVRLRNVQTQYWPAEQANLKLEPGFKVTVVQVK